MALAEEIKGFKQNEENGNNGENWQQDWERTFNNCFLRVDDEIEGKVGRPVSGSSGDVSDTSFEPVAPETVGSTAVVALVCSSHIIVANCGDSRAVLCRGKEPMALSVDHKVRTLHSISYSDRIDQPFSCEGTNSKCNISAAKSRR